MMIMTKIQVVPNSPQVMSISSVTFQSYNGAEKMNLQLVLKVLAVTAIPWSHDQIWVLGDWPIFMTHTPLTFIIFTCLPSATLTDTSWPQAI